MVSPPIPLQDSTEIRAVSSETRSSKSENRNLANEAMSEWTLTKRIKGKQERVIPGMSRKGNWVPNS